MRRFLSAALIGNVLLLFAGISFAEEKTESAVPIIFEKTENVVIEAGKIRLPQEQVQDEKTGLVVIEAEDAASINYTEKIYQNSADLAGADTEASNGYFISHVQGVKYIFHITKPGKYFIWSRVWQPWEGYWNRTEMMDDDSVSAEANNDARLKADELNKDRNVLASARRNSVTDLNTGEAKVKEWVWIKPRSIATKQPLIYDLSAGKHELKFDFNGGIRLDKIIITDDPSFKPEGKGPAICKGKGADEGLIVTGDITPKTVNKWKSLRGIFSENGGKIGVSYSADRGKTWTEINSDSALDSVPAKGDGSDKMRFRFSVKRSSQNFSPVMSNLELAYLSGNKAGFIQPLSEIPAENMDSTGRFELVPENSLGFVSQNDKSLSLSDQVFYAEKGRPVIFEAEDFVEAKFYPDNSNGVLLEQDASAGKAVYQFPHYRNQLRYDFYLHESAEYSVWFRLRFEQFDGSSFLYASIDEGRQNASGIEMPKGYNPSAGWVFVKGPSFFLGNGVHSFYIRGRLDYVHIDQIAIIRKDKKPEDSGLTGNGPFAVSGVKANGYGEILFSAVSPSSIKNWKKVKTDLKANGGTVTAKVSADNGKTWTDSEKIRTLSVKNDGSDKLIVKLAVQRKNLKNSPELFKTYAEYEPGDRKDIVLKNSLLELFFTPDGALNGLRDVRNDRWILPRGLSQKVFELNIRVKGENNLRLFSPGKGAVLNGREFRKDGKKQSVSFEYAMLDYALRLKFTVALDDSSVSKWNLEITNDSQVEVRDYTFVSFRGFRLGKSGIDDLAAWCTTIGGLYPVPGAAGVNWINQMRYPGDAAMPWTDFSDGQGGVFLCSYDKTLTATDMWCDPGMSLSSWDFGYRKNAYVPPGKKWNTEYEIAVHDKDWHWSADRYHNWFYSWNEKPVYPDWVKNSQGWGGGVLFCCRLYSRFATHWWPRAQWLGLSHFEDWGTTADGESCGLWNHFNPRFGSKEDFAAANKALDKSGAHFGGYINVRGWSDEFVKDPDWVGCTPKKFFKKEDLAELEPAGYADRIKGMYINGSLVQGGPGACGIPGMKQASACDGDSSPGGWHDHMTKWCAQVNAGEYGCDVVYIDQAACTPPFLCYNDKHGHGQDHGANGRLLAELLKRIVTEGRKLNPDFVLAMEGLVDCHAQWAPMGLYVGTELNKGEIYIYTHPWHFYYRGSSNGGGWSPIPMEHRLALLFLFNRFDNVGELNTLRTVIQLRERIKDWMFNGVFMDNTGISADRPNVLAKLFVRDEKGYNGALINICNLNRVSDASISFCPQDIPGLKDMNSVTALVVGLDSKISVLKLEKKDGVFKIPVPQTLASSVLMIKHAPEDENIRLFSEQPLEASEKSHLKIMCANLSDEKVNASVSVSADLFNLSEKEFNIEIPACATAEKIIDISNADELKARTCAEIRLAWKGKTGSFKKETKALLYPPVLNGDFETDENKDGYADVWGTDSAGFFHTLAQFTVDAPAPLLGLDGELDSSNPKEGKYSLKLRGRMTFHYRDFEGTAVADWDASWLKQSKKPAIWFPEITQRIILNPNTAYELSFWAKTDAVAKDNITFEAPGGVSINFKDDQDCVNQWKNYKLAIPPVNVEGAQIIRVKNCSDQTFWVDDIKITRKEIKLEAKADDSKKESFQPASVNPMPLAEKAVSSGTVSTENTRQAGEIPDFEKSPQDAIGILFDEEIRTFNLIPLPPNVEGSLEKRNAGNKTGWAIVPTPKEKGGNGAEMMYFTVFNDFPSWKGISGIKVEVEYFDATPGALVFRYDSTEDSIWMAMPPEETGLVLKGDKVWKKTVFSLASPAFKKRCNGGDFRFDFSRNKDSDPKENVILKKITVFKE